jgi:4'-phosphopantetheinyl transferase
MFRDIQVNMVETFLLDQNRKLTQEEFIYLLEFVDGFKFDRIQSYKNWQDAQSLLISDLFSRYIISFKTGHLGVHFEYNSLGKPFVSNLDYLFFNTSRLENLIVCVWDNSPIGVTLKKVSEYNINEYLSDFSEAELLYINNFPESKKIEIAIEIWTQKLSFYKSRNENYKSSEISILKESNQAKLYIHNKIQSDYYFKSEQMNKDYMFSICSLSNESI